MLCPRANWAFLICRIHQYYYCQWLPNTEWSNSGSAWVEGQWMAREGKTSREGRYFKTRVHGPRMVSTAVSRPNYISKNNYIIVRLKASWAGLICSTHQHYRRQWLPLSSVTCHVLQSLGQPETIVACACVYRHKTLLLFFYMSVLGPGETMLCVATAAVAALPTGMFHHE